MGYAIRIRGPGGIWSGGLLGSCGKYEFQEPEKFAHLRARDDEGREQAQCKIVRAIDQQAALHGFADEGPAFDGEFDADHQTFGADFTDEAEFRSEFGKAIAQLSAARADIFEKLFIFDDI